MESLLLGNICQLKTYNCQSKLMEGSEVRSVGTRISVGFSECLKATETLVCLRLFYARELSKYEFAKVYMCIKKPLLIFHICTNLS